MHRFLRRSMPLRLYGGILDTYVKEGSTQNFSHDERLWISNTNYYGNRLTYLKVVDLGKKGNEYLSHPTKPL